VSRALYNYLVTDVERILSEENQSAAATPALTTHSPAAAAAAAPKQTTKTMSRTSRITPQLGLPPSSPTEGVQSKVTDVKNQDVIKVDPLPLPLTQHHSGIIASYQPPKRLVSLNCSNAFLVYLRARGTCWWLQMFSPPLGELTALPKSLSWI